MATGESHVRYILGVAEKHFGTLRRGAALDFGCGVGRVLLPIARCFETATGVDVSPSMLHEAQRNAAMGGQENVTLVHSPERLQGITGEFDFVHSVMVFQHIPVDRGEGLIMALADRLAPGGVAALHVNLKVHRPAWRSMASGMRKYASILDIPANLLNGRPWDEPMMQMNSYSLDRLFLRLAGKGFSRVLLERSDDGAATQTFLMFQKPKSATL
jgi:SAM-dependent methyltransferase